MCGLRRCSKCGEWITVQIEYIHGNPNISYICPNGCHSNYETSTYTAIIRTFRYCLQKQCMCENANNRGYCEFTASNTKPTRAGYTFSAWNTAQNGSGTSYAPGGSYTANAAVTLYAQWTVQSIVHVKGADGMLHDGFVYIKGSDGEMHIGIVYVKGSDGEMHVNGQD